MPVNGTSAESRVFPSRARTLLLGVLEELKRGELELDKLELDELELDELGLWRDVRPLV